jgi:anaerobic selenocysteine-containing dehydrogenase
MEQKSLTMTRRDFVKTVITMGAALAVPLAVDSTILKTIAPVEAQAAQQAAGQVKTVIKGFGWHGRIGAAPALIDVQNGRILRIRTLYYNWKYPDYPRWTMQSHGMTFTPNWNSMPHYTALGYKHRVYSPNRVLYPLKRVDWDPNGNRNEQNRGKSPFVRISWDEALTYIANEVKRIKETYGPEAIFCT